MSILSVAVTSHGIVFAADRNVTHLSRHEGKGGQVVEVHGQTQRPKILRWPHRKALVGYVGAASIAGIPTDDWLYDFIGDNASFSGLETLSKELRAKVETQRRVDEGDHPPEGLIIHVAGFEELGGIQVPQVWYIRNPHSMANGEYTDIRKEFLVSEEFLPNMQKVVPGIREREIRTKLTELEARFTPFWFHQGLDLLTFNTLDSVLTQTFGALSRIPGSKHQLPQRLDDWERYARMAVLTHGAFFQVFKGPGEQMVGGGVDSLSIAWPGRGEVHP